jgi:predicted transcriptional regulator
MANVTLSVDDELLREARKIAVDRDTSVSEIVRRHLTELVERERVRRSFIAKHLDELFAASTAASEGRRVRRETLHER